MFLYYFINNEFSRNLVIFHIIINEQVNTFDNFMYLNPIVFN